ncbi:MAG: acetylglutamate kinase [Chloroflexi bacterium]|nr:acetylglutamate kinase [Chloroflexota bacterium]MCL5074836.1 acetylglutamate kinase [Chloroflexota bacterium]
MQELEGLVPLEEAQVYIDRFAGKTVVVKLGGSALGSHDTTLEDVIILRKLGINTVLVHGGGSDISQWLRRIGKEARFVQGLRVTDAETIEVVLMVLAGKVNKELVAGLESRGGRAIGLSGIDGGLIRARRKNEQLGLVGEVVAINLAPLKAVIEAGYIAVVAPLGFGENGECLNINADTAAAEIAVALQGEKMIFLTDVPGISNRAGELIPYLTPSEARELITSKVVSGGMIPKVEACLRALDSVKRAHIIDGRVPHALLKELLTDRGIGTMISR